jgi:hypothetical protein
MSIGVSWSDDKKTAVLLAFDGKWNWLDFDYAMVQALALIKNVDHKVSLVFDLRHSGQLAAGAMYEERELREALPLNFGLLVAVGETRFANATMVILTRVYAQLGDSFTVLHSIEEAHQYLYGGNLFLSHAHKTA